MQLTVRLPFVTHASNSERATLDQSNAVQNNQYGKDCARLPTDGTPSQRNIRRLQYGTEARPHFHQQVKYSRSDLNCSASFESGVLR